MGGMVTLKYTTIQKNGELRTIDTNDATLFDLIVEFALWPVDEKARKNRKARKEALRIERRYLRQNVKFNWWVIIGMAAFFFFILILGMLT